MLFPAPLIHRCLLLWHNLRVMMMPLTTKVLHALATKVWLQSAPELGAPFLWLLMTVALPSRSVEVGRAAWRIALTLTPMLHFSLLACA